MGGDAARPAELLLQAPFPPPLRDEQLGERTCSCCARTSRARAALRYLYGNGDRRADQGTDEGNYFREFFVAVNWDGAGGAPPIEDDAIRTPFCKYIVRAIAYLALEWETAALTLVDVDGSNMVSAQIKSLRARNPGLSNSAARKLVETFIGPDQGFVQTHHNAKLPKDEGHFTQQIYQQIIAEEKALQPTAARKVADVLQYRLFLLSTTEDNNREPGARHFRVSPLLPILGKARRYITLDGDAATWIKPNDCFTQKAARNINIADFLLNTEYHQRLIGKGWVPARTVQTNGITLNVICRKKGEEEVKPEKFATSKKRKREAEEATKGVPAGFLVDPMKTTAADPNVGSVIVAARPSGRRHRNGMHHFEITHNITREQWRKDTGQHLLTEHVAAAMQRSAAARAATTAMSLNSLRTTDLDLSLGGAKVHIAHRGALVRVTASRKVARLRFHVDSRTRSVLAKTCNSLLGPRGSDRRLVFGAATFMNHPARGPILKLRDYLLKERPDQVFLVDEFRTSKASALSVFRGHCLDLEQMVGDVKKKDGTITRGEVWAVKQSKTENYTVNRDLNACMNIWFIAYLQSQFGTSARPVGLRKKKAT